MNERTDATQRLTRRFRAVIILNLYITSSVDLPNALSALVSCELRTDLWVNCSYGSANLANSAFHPLGIGK